MLKLSDLALPGRPVRQDDVEELGAATPGKICEAIDDGRLGDAKKLARYVIGEGKALHDLMCDWVWNLLSEIARRHGESEMYRILRATQETWMMKRTWRGFLKLSVQERGQVTAEIMRAHRSGPKQDGGIEIIEEDDRYVIKMDPCGSGGRPAPSSPGLPPLLPGIGEWSTADLTWFLESGLKPDGDDAQGLMGEVIEYGFQYLTEADRQALAVYLASLPPIHNELSAPQDE